MKKKNKEKKERKRANHEPTCALYLGKGKTIRKEKNNNNEERKRQ